MMTNDQPQAPIASEKLIAGRKVFFLDLKENQRGQVLKITEDVAGRRNTIMVPIEIVRELGECCVRLAEFAGTL